MVARDRPAAPARRAARLQPAGRSTRSRGGRSMPLGARAARAPECVIGPCPCGVPEERLATRTLATITRSRCAPGPGSRNAGMRQRGEDTPPSPVEPVAGRAWGGRAGSTPGPAAVQVERGSGPAAERGERVGGGGDGSHVDPATSVASSAPVPRAKRAQQPVKTLNTRVQPGPRVRRRRYLAWNTWTGRLPAHSPVPRAPPPTSRWFRKGLRSSWLRSRVTARRTRPGGYLGPCAESRRRRRRLPAPPRSWASSARSSIRRVPPTFDLPATRGARA